MPADGGDAEDVLHRFAGAGVDVAAVAEQLQHKGAQSFADSRNKLLVSIASKSAVPHLPR
jgi:transaldolase